MLGGFGGKADQLNAYNTTVGTPDAFDADLARYLTATPEQFARRRRTGSIRRLAVALSVVPQGQGGRR